MINDIIALLPSQALKEKIRETKHQFAENELLQIIYRYAPTFEERLALLERFAQQSASDVSALARVYIEHEQEKFKRFIEAPEGFVYELRIKESPEAYEEKYLCASYSAALACIDGFYEEYEGIGDGENSRTRYEILKRKIFSEGDKFEEDVYAEMVLGAGKTVLEVSDHRLPHECKSDLLCSECNEICVQRWDDVYYPCFVHDRDIVRYLDGEGNTCYGVNLCVCDVCDGLVSELYVIPLDSATIRERRFENDFYDHQHIEVPLATLASPEVLEDTMRKNYFDFLAYLDAK